MKATDLLERAKTNHHGKRKHLFEFFERDRSCINFYKSVFKTEEAKPTIMTTKTTNILYWVFTIIFAGLMIFSAVPNVGPDEQSIEIFIKVLDIQSILFSLLALQRSLVQLPF